MPTRLRLAAGTPALLVTLGLMGYGGYRLLFVEPGAPVNVPRDQRYATACLKPDAPMTQSFRVVARALRALTLYPTPSSTPVSGDLVVELREGDEDTSLPASLQRVNVEAAQLGGRDAFTIELPRAEPAGGRTFTVSIARTAADGCVAFQASGVNMPDGRLRIGDRVQWGDLLFRAHADRGTILHLVQQWLGDRLGLRLPLVVVGALAAAYALALLWLCRALMWQAATASTRS